ncbi:MAG: hypothetical protein LH473_01435 [Chitinophagales bacterium]|nr:hypothetical protein [Chitinophagales bacterium]
MEEKPTQLETLFEKAEVLAKTTVELYKLKAIDKSADVVASLAASVAIIISISLIGIMLNIGLALWIGELLGKSYFGFFIVAAFYSVVALILFFFKQRLIKTPINNSIITQFLKEKTA